MTKEFNYDSNDSYTLSFMGNELLLHKLNGERNYKKKYLVPQKLRLKKGNHELEITTK